MEEEGVVGSWVEQNGSGGRKETPQAEGGVTAGEPEVLEAGAHGAGSRGPCAGCHGDRNAGEKCPHWHLPLLCGLR